MSRSVKLLALILPVMMCVALYCIHKRFQPEPELSRNSRPDLFYKPPPKSGYFTPKTDRLPVKQIELPPPNDR